MTDESDLTKNGINGPSVSVTTNDRRIATIKQENVFSSSNEAMPETGTAHVKGEFTQISNNKQTCIPTSNIAWTITTLKQEKLYSSNETIADANATRAKCEISQISNEKETRNSSWTHADSDATAVGGLDVHSSQSGIGGRLQFFKDGKFILELARTREGEKEGWISVPRKTYWPLSTTTLIYTKNESSASLSFSDDNSSIQSSPWQRDHCWKQTSPRRNISKEMCMFFRRTRKFMLSERGYKIAHIKRRRPYDNSVCKMPFTLSNGLIKSKCEDTANGTVLNINQKTVNEECSNISGENKKSRVRAKLSATIQKLIDRLPTGLFYLSKTAIVGGSVTPLTGTLSKIVELHNPQQHVSPRKRILRELEKVSLEDNINKRFRARSSTIFSPSITTTTSATFSTLTTSTNLKSNISNMRSGQITNGNAIEQSTTITTPSRLYSSYSIHSLLGNISGHNNKSENISYQNTKEGNDPSYLRIMLATPNPSDNNNHFGKSSAFINSAKKSPTNSILPETNCKSPSSETDNNIDRLKTLSTSASSTSFHPYLSSPSPKYSSSSSVLTNTSSDSYKIKTGRTSASPNHTHVSGSNRSSPNSAFSHSSQSSVGSRYCNRTSPSNSRIKELSPSDNISPKVERREGTSRTVPKKTAALRQQFTSPSSSPSTLHGDSSYIYTTSNNHKKRNADERSITPEKQIYHHGVDIEHCMGSVLRSSALPPSALYYMYPRHGSPGGPSATPYIPPVSYYHPYAAAVAALRNPLWIHYQTGVMPPTGPPSRLGASLFPYNGASPGPPQIPSPLPSMQLSTGSVKSWHTPANQHNLSTDVPVSLASKKDEPSSDTPLNLSKH